MPVGNPILMRTWETLSGLSRKKDVNLRGRHMGHTEEIREQRKRIGSKCTVLIYKNSRDKYINVKNMTPSDDSNLNMLQRSS